MYKEDGFLKMVEDPVVDDVGRGTSWWPWYLTNIFQMGIWLEVAEDRTMKEQKIITGANTAKKFLEEGWLVKHVWVEQTRNSSGGPGMILTTTTTTHFVIEKEIPPIEAGFINEQT